MSPTAPLCQARWTGGRCSRPASATLTLCHGHYAQDRRNAARGRAVGVYAPLRRPLELVRVTIYVPEVHAADVLAHARERGMREPDVYREAVREFVSGREAGHVVELRLAALAAIRAQVQHGLDSDEMRAAMNRLNAALTPPA